MLVLHKAAQLENLLAEGVSKTQQTDDEIRGDQLLNFLANSLDGEVAFSFVEDAEPDAGGICEVFVNAYVNGISVLVLRGRNGDALHENSVPYHPRTKFGLGTLEQVGNMPLQEDVLDVLPQQVEVYVDLHLWPHYGDEDDTDGLCHSQVKREITAFHVYATLYVCVKNKRYTLAVCRLEDGDTTSNVLTEFLGILDGLDLGVEVVYLNCESCDSRCLTLLQARNHAYVTPIVRWGRAVKRELSEGWSRVTQHSLTARFDSHNWTVEFLAYIDCTYQNGRYDEHGVARHGHATDAPFTDSPRDARCYYAKRLGIEVSYRLSEQSIATTSTQNPVVRLLYVAVSLLLQDMWRYLHQEHVATPHRGGCRLWQQSFKKLINMVRWAAWATLATRRAVPANRPPDDRSHW